MTSSSPPPSPAPPHNSDIVAAAAERPSPSQPKIDIASSNGLARDVFGEMPRLSHLEVLNSEDYIEKYRKYESDFMRMLMAKYFTSKNIHGGNVYEEKITIGDETIMSSRWPCTQTFADPTQGFQEQDGHNPASVEKSPNSISNGDLSLEKNE